MASAVSALSSSILLSSSSVYLPFSSSINLVSNYSSYTSISTFSSPNSLSHTKSRKPRNLICLAAEYKFPDPIPEFADAETEKFRDHLLKKLPKKQDVYGDSVDEIVGICTEETEKFRDHLLKKLPKKQDVYGDSVDEIVGICTEILNDFLHAEYGGPGTLLVVPFIDMADTINERGLPGGPQAARAAVKWAQAHVDNDWKEWNSSKRR